MQTSSSLSNLELVGSLQIQINVFHPIWEGFLPLFVQLAFLPLFTSLIKRFLLCVRYCAWKCLIGFWGSVCLAPFFFLSVSGKDNLKWYIFEFAVSLFGSNLLLSPGDGIFNSVIILFKISIWVLFYSNFSPSVIFSTWWDIFLILFISSLNTF